MIEVSVVIPTHNRKELLRRVLTALNEQDFPQQQLEVVVVVDAATDGTWEMLQELHPDYRLRPVWQNHGGAARARNRGADEAVGRLLIFIDDDIIPLPGFVAEHLRSHRQHPRGVVQGLLSPDPASNRPGWIRYQEGTMQKRYNQIQSNGKGLELLYSGNFSLPRAAFQEVGGFDACLSRDEDIELGYRLLQLGLSFHFNAAAHGYHYDGHPFESWLSTQQRYGRLDVELYRDRAHARGLATLFDFYHARHLLNRMLIGVSIKYPFGHRALVRIFRQCASTTDRMQLWGLSFYSYSALANLEYWYSVAESLGGAEIFRGAAARYSTGRTEAELPAA